MLCSPTKVPAVIIHELLPVSSQLGTATGGKLLRFGGGVYWLWANAACALNTNHRTISTTTGIVYLLIRNFVSLIGRLSASELDSFTSQRLSLALYINLYGLSATFD
jgi:hypothetical protein